MRTEESQTPESRKGVHLWWLLWKATKAVEAPAHRSVKAEDLGLTDFCVLDALLHKGRCR
jgi:MarR family transcriptional regulator, 2-MHQ and catechol-resistance regulon repressor